MTCSTVQVLLQCRPQNEEEHKSNVISYNKQKKKVNVFQKIFSVDMKKLQTCKLKMTTQHLRICRSCPFLLLIFQQTLFRRDVTVVNNKSQKTKLQLTKRRLHGYLSSDLGLHTLHRVHLQSHKPYCLHRLHKHHQVGSPLLNSPLTVVYPIHSICREHQERNETTTPSITMKVSRRFQIS